MTPVLVFTGKAGKRFSFTGNWLFRGKTENCSPIETLLAASPISRYARSMGYHLPEITLEKFRCDRRGDGPPF